MTGKERFVNALTFKPVDRVPKYELCLWGQTYERWLLEGLPQDALSTSDFFPGEPYFGFDRREFIHINTSIIPYYESETLEETDRYIVVRHAGGGVTKALKEGTVRGTRASMDQHLKAPVENMEDFLERKTRMNPNSPARYPKYLEDLARDWNRRDYPLQLLGNGAFGFYSGGRTMMDTEGFSIAIYENPKLVHAMMEHLCYLMCTIIEKVLPYVTVDSFNFFEDMAYKTAPLISPAKFKEFMFPHYRKVCDLLKKFNVPVIMVDTDGNSEPLFPLLIEAGVNCVWPLEQASENTDPVELRKKYGRALAFAGGIDKRALTKSKKEIDAELESKIPPMLESGGYIPIIDHAVSPDISYPNFLYYLEKKYKLIEGR